MGQRLVIEIVNNDKVLASSYYHWSGYTSCAQETALTIIENFDASRRVDINYAVELLKTTGAKPKESLDVNRNEGLIETTQKGIDENRYWAEAVIVLNVVKRKATMEIVWEVVDEEDIEDYKRGKDCIKSSETTFNPLEVSFEDFSSNYSEYKRLLGLEIYGIDNLETGKYFRFIE